jgi:hypothetical protein
MREHTEHTHTEEEKQFWAMPDSGVMKYIEGEAALMIASAKKVAAANEVDQKQALWLVMTLYQDFYK